MINIEIYLWLYLANFESTMAPLSLLLATSMFANESFKKLTT